LLKYLFVPLQNVSVYVDMKSKIAATTKRSLTWNAIGKEI